MKKDIESQASEEPKKKEQLGLASLVFLMFFAVSGGAFGSEELVSTSGGGMALVLIIVTPLVFSVPVAVIVAELTSAVPAQGGLYVWVGRAFNPFLGFCAGWWMYIALLTGSALSPIFMVSYIEWLTGPEALAGWKGNLLSVGIVWLCAIINLRGPVLTGRMSIVLGILVLSPFAVVFLWGLKDWHHNPFTPFVLPGLSTSDSLSLGLFIAMWNYTNWDKMSSIAGDVENPGKTFPKALAIAVPFVVAVYLLPFLIGLATAGQNGILWQLGAWSSLSDFIAGGTWLGIIMDVAGCISMGSLFLTSYLAPAALLETIAAGGDMPGFLAWKNRYGAQWVAVLMVGVCYTGLLFVPMAALFVVNIVTYALPLGLEIYSVVALRIKEPHLERPFKVPGNAVVVALIAAMPLILVIAASFDQIFAGGFSLTGFSYVMSGLALELLSAPLIWFIWGRNKHKRKKAGEYKPLMGKESLTTPVN